jgi:hypothetical protein
MAQAESISEIRGGTEVKPTIRRIKFTAKLRHLSSFGSLSAVESTPCAMSGIMRRTWITFTSVPSNTGWSSRWLIGSYRRFIPASDRVCIRPIGRHTNAIPATRENAGERGLVQCQSALHPTCSFILLWLFGMRVWIGVTPSYEKCFGSFFQKRTTSFSRPSPGHARVRLGTRQAYALTCNRKVA